MYNVTYSTLSGSCHSVIVLPSFCGRGICSNEFDISSSSCPRSVDINVFVFATNTLGDGLLSNSVTIGRSDACVDKVVMFSIVFQMLSMNL